MSYLILFGLAKINDLVRRPWLLAGIYIMLIMLLTLILSAGSIKFGLLALLLTYTFIVAGLWLTLLLQFEDSIVMWLLLVITGILVIDGGIFVIEKLF